ncbi:MAG: DUF6383 domain-containing protein [Bacteroidales bacterium]
MQNSTLFNFKNMLLLFAMACMGTSLSAQTVIFEERFDENKGEGGNDGKWAAISATVAPVGLEDWVLASANGASECIRSGSGSKQGIITTPALKNLTGNAVLTFRAGAWEGDQTSLLLEITGGGTLDQSSVTIERSNFTNFTVNITDGTPDTQITFKGKQASKSRFFLDDVVITQNTETGIENNLADQNLTITAVAGGLEISSDTDTTLTICRINGQLIRQTAITTGKTTIALPQGIYLVNRTKVVVY